MAEALKRRLNCVLVAGGRYHDIDFARLEILKLLAEDDRVRVRVFEDYSNIEAIAAADFLITYHLRRGPATAGPGGAQGLRGPGRAPVRLHGTNSILRFLESGPVDSPRWAPHVMETSRIHVRGPIRPSRPTG